MMYSLDMSSLLVPSALPRLMVGSRDTGILLLHGWTGYPGQHYFLGEALNREGYTVSIPRLPGHGTDRTDFLKSGAADWIRRAEDAFMELGTIKKQVIPVGVSMGALLALHIGARWSVPWYCGGSASDLTEKQGSLSFSVFQGILSGSFRHIWKKKRLRIRMRFI